MIQDFEDLAEYILNNYRNKVVEVGVGNQPYVALLLKDRMDVVITDVSPCLDREVFQNSGIRFYMDDILNPDARIYKNSSLIYSIRPPIDLQEAIARTAKEAGADLLIRPFGDEKADLARIFRNYSLKNFKKARFYLYRADIR
ncbi:MAG TPA: UPF0146 family protein [Candidatus Methanoperedens sp.]